MKIRNLLLSIVTVLPLMLAAKLSYGQSAEELLASLDTDGNGSISKEEAAASDALIANWDAVDADANGEISAEELAAAMTQ